MPGHERFSPPLSTFISGVSAVNGNNNAVIFVDKLLSDHFSSVQDALDEFTHATESKDSDSAHIMSFQVGTVADRGAKLLNFPFKLIAHEQHLALIERTIPFNKSAELESFYLGSGSGPIFMKEEMPPGGMKAIGPALKD